MLLKAYGSLFMESLFDSRRCTYRQKDRQGCVGEISEVESPD